MKYKYPKICNCLIYKRCAGDFVEVTDFLTDKVYRMNVEEAKYVKKLDGKTHPYSIKTKLTKKEVCSLIKELDNYGLLRKSNKMAEGGTVLRTIWEPKWTINLRVIAFLCNSILMLSWLPVFIVGIIMFMNNWLSMDMGLAVPGALIGFVSGIILHEFGHAFAGASYGARVFEMGILRMYYIVPGAYVFLDKRSVKDRFKRVQINAAGVEVNLFLAGAFLILASIFVNLGGMFFAAAVQNAFLAAVNLTLIKGLDGMAIISELLGLEDVVETMAEVMFDKTLRKELREYGISGNATVTACYVFGALQLALPVLLLLNVLEVVVCVI